MGNQMGISPRDRQCVPTNGVIYIGVIESSNRAAPLPHQQDGMSLSGGEMCDKANKELGEEWIFQKRYKKNEKFNGVLAFSERIS